MFDNRLGQNKDRRKQYYDSRRINVTCRNHGSCKYCISNRTFSRRRLERFAEADLIAVMTRLSEWRMN